jgi:hypothetical protein
MLQQTKTIIVKIPIIGGNSKFQKPNTREIPKSKKQIPNNFQYPNFNS